MRKSEREINRERERQRETECERDRERAIKKERFDVNKQRKLIQQRERRGKYA